MPDGNSRMMGVAQVPVNDHKEDESEKARASAKQVEEIRVAEHRERRNDVCVCEKKSDRRSGTVSAPHQANQPNGAICDAQQKCKNCTRQKKEAHTFANITYTQNKSRFKLSMN